MLITKYTQLGKSSIKKYEDERIVVFALCVITILYHLCSIVTANDPKHRGGANDFEHDMQLAS